LLLLGKEELLDLWQLEFKLLLLVDGFREGQQMLLMVGKLVSLQTLLVVVVSVAVRVRTVELFTLTLLEMGLKMRAIVVAGKELLIALGTLVGLFTSVDLLVSLEVGDLGEGFLAAGVLTLVGLLSGMDSEVLLQ